MIFKKYSISELEAVTVNHMGNQTCRLLLAQDCHLSGQGATPHCMAIFGSSKAEDDDLIRHNFYTKF